jgi:hypothetical protein
LAKQKVATSRARLEISPNSKPFSIAGQFSLIGVLTGSLPRDRFFVSAFYDGPANTWLGGFDAGATFHWTSAYADDNFDVIRGLTQIGTVNSQTRAAKGKEPFVHNVNDWYTLDLIASYKFNLPRPAAAQVPGLAKDGGKNVKMPDGKEENVLPVSTAQYNPYGWRA